MQLKALGMGSKMENPHPQLSDKPEPSRSEIGYGSDAIAEQLSRLDLKYMALVPGSSYRGLHDSLVNYKGNASPEMLICLHEVLLSPIQRPSTLESNFLSNLGACSLDSSRICKDHGEANGSRPTCKRRPYARNNGYLQCLL